MGPGDFVMPSCEEDDIDNPANEILNDSIDGECLHRGGSQPGKSANTDRYRENATACFHQDYFALKCISPNTYPKVDTVVKYSCILTYCSLLFQRLSMVEKIAVVIS